MRKMVPLHSVPGMEKSAAPAAAARQVFGEGIDALLGGSKNLHNLTGSAKNIADTFRSALESKRLLKELGPTRLPSVVRKGGVILGAGAALGVGSHAAASLYEQLRRGLTADSNFKSLLAENPDLAKKPVKDVRKVFDVIHEFSPEVSRIPAVAGAVVRRAMEFKDVGMTPTALKELTDVSRSVNDLRGSRGSLGGSLRDLGGLGLRFGLG